MAYPIVNDSVVEITFEGRHQQQQTMSLFHYRVSGTTGVTDGEELIRNFITELRGADELFAIYSTILSTELRDLNVYGQLVYPVRYRYTSDGAPDVTGDTPGGAFPPNVQAAITRAAEKAGRKYISHLSLPALPLDSITDGKITNVFKANMEALCEVIPKVYVMPGGVEFTPVIWHRTSTPNDDPITFAFPQDTSRVMRRRTVGLGS